MGHFPGSYVLRVQQHFRRQRAELFRRWMQPSEQDRILDLGGGYGDYFATVVPFRRNVWVADLDERILERAQRHGFQTALIAAGEALPFPDRAFDIVHCNSVIEHVLPTEQRVRLAREICRVGRNWFIQTPNRYFFLEPHTCLPLAQFVPRPLLRWIMRRIGGFWGWDDLQWKLLSSRELLSLFPQSTLVRERLVGWTKSLVVVGGDGSTLSLPPRPVRSRHSSQPYAEVS